MGNVHYSSRCEAEQHENVIQCHRKYLQIAKKSGGKEGMKVVLEKMKMVNNKFIKYH